MNSLSMLTDLYQLTMAAGYWKLGMADQEAIFHLFFRKAPFKGSYAVMAGLNRVIEYIEGFGFEVEDLEYLRGLKTAAGTPLFEEPFLEYLGKLKMECSIDAVPEGRFVFPQTPLMRIRAPLLQAQLLETTLLTLINFPTLIATKASRIRAAAPDDHIVEFGLRRAQGPDGGITGARAAYVGGCDSTSCVKTGQIYGIPVKGTHAHSWVMAFDDEEASFEGYAQVMEDNCVLLIDTYDSVAAVQKAIRVGRKLAERGKRLIAVRLDSGDLLSLSKQCRKLLDEAGMQDVQIMATNELDEHRIASLKDAGAPITIWGVGTRLATGHPDAALGGVYKLSAIRKNGEWAYRAKRSDQPEKSSPPGILQVDRFSEASGEPTHDLVYDIERGHGETGGEELLKPIFEKGKLVYKQPPLTEIRETALAELDRFSAEGYPVHTEDSLLKTKLDLIGG